ncbi:MAG: hypothetical protein GY801_49320 [bacterium]|nr:hypothetical protein [bacterium]
MKTHTIGKLFGTVLCIAICCMLALSAMANETFELKKRGDDWFTFKQHGGGWQAESPALSLTVTKDGGEFKFETPDATYRLEERDPGKFKLYSANGSFKLKVKFDGEKRKIYRREEGDADWSLKLKAEKGKFQVSQGETGIGQVKFYPDDAQIKAKNTGGDKLCTMQSDRLRSAPGVCFFPELSEEEQLIVFTIFMLLD